MNAVRCRIENRVAEIELSRYDKKNALTAEMYGLLSDALAAAAAERGVRAILVHGRADCFTAGNDINDFLVRRTDETSPALRFMNSLAAAEKPVVAAVGGPAVGIGTTMLLHCDLVYAAPGTRFQMPFVPLGIVPEFGSTLLLPQIAGYQRAAELLLTGKPFDAQKALAAGIVTEIVPEEGLIARAREAALELASLPPESVRLTKQLLRSAGREPLAARIAEEASLLRERLGSPEAREAMNAFLEKRKPDFSRF